jgi:hypothetical protein
LDSCRSSQIKQKQDAIVAEFPQSSRWRPEDMSNPALDARVIFCRLLLKLDELQNDFFLYRLLIRTGRPDEGSLLATSFQLVSLVLTLWTNMDRFAEMRPDFAWLVSA